jgi:acyl-coenzyme A synthetase/AMP-(fatty) acid ligase
MPAAFIPLSTLLATGRPEDAPVCTDGDRRLNWGDFARRAGAIARAVSQRDGQRDGLRGARREEQRWLIHCEQPFNFAAALLAVLYTGKRAIVAPGFQPGLVEQLRPAFDAIVGENSFSEINLSTLAPAAFDFAPLAPRAALIDLFTSGSSGEPKRVEKSLAQLETEAGVLEACWGEAIGRATVVATVPHHHIYGLLFRLVWPLGAGRPFDAALCADPALLHERLARAGDAVIVSSPAHLARLPELIELESLRPATRAIFSSGGPLPATAALEFKRRLGAAPIEVYGSTETGGVAWRTQSDGEDGAAWTPFPGMAIEADAEGALRLRSPYLPDGGWLTLGDAVELLADGRFRLKGRLDRVAKIEGKRVSLPELEQGLRQHPWVLDAAVVPLAGRREKLGAIVVLREPARLRDEGRQRLVAALRASLLERFDRVVVPRHWRFAQRLPTDERGKLSAQALSALFLKESSRSDDATAT